MSRRLGVRPAVVLIVPALAATVALAGCAAGTDALTNQARTTTDSVYGAVGTISLANVYVAGPVTKGGDAQIISAFFNDGHEADSITGVSSPAAAGGRVPARSQLAAGGGELFIADGSAPTLLDVKSDLRVGEAVPVTFTFARAGSLTLQVPVEEPQAGASASPTATASPTEGASPTASPTNGTTPSPTATATP